MNFFVRINNDRYRTCFVNIHHVAGKLGQHAGKDCRPVKAQRTGLHAEMVHASKVGQARSVDRQPKKPQQAALEAGQFRGPQSQTRRLVD